MPKFKYLTKGIIHSGMLNPWPINKDGAFEKVTEEINKLANEGWELITVIPAGNNDRGIYFFRKAI